MTEGNLRCLTLNIHEQVKKLSDSDQEATALSLGVFVFSFLLFLLAFRR
jgi:hypothetical protein